MKKILTAVLLSAAILAGGAALYVRSVEMDPAVWHADPTLGERTGRPNDALAGDSGDLSAPILPGTVAEVATRVDAVALAEPRVERIAGTPEEGWMTYVQRSALMGYPDAVSVRVLPEGDGARVVIWSRSRFGQSDMGVNRERIDRWLAALQP
jgi:uncharacterized protein (DUF1499 family)